MSNCLPQRSVSIHSQYPLPRPEALSQVWSVLRHAISAWENNLVYGGNKIALRQNLSYIWLQSGLSFIDHDKSHLAWNLPAKRFTTFEAMVSRRLSMIVLETKRRTHDARNEFENTNGGHEFTKAFLENETTYAVRYWKIQQATRSFPW